MIGCGLRPYVWASYTRFFVECHWPSLLLLRLYWISASLCLALHNLLVWMERLVSCLFPTFMHRYYMSCHGLPYLITYSNRYWYKYLHSSMCRGKLDLPTSTKAGSQSPSCPFFLFISISTYPMSLLATCLFFLLVCVDLLAHSFIHSCFYVCLLYYLPNAATSISVHLM